MANQPETATYDAGVFQLETTTAVTGGVGGAANAPLLNLANRTAYLKQHLDALEAGTYIPATVAPLASPALTGNPTAPTQLPGNNSTRISTTAYTDGAVATGISGRQPLATNLTLFAGLSLAADKLAYATGSGALALTAFTALGRTLVAGATASAMRTTLGLVLAAGSDLQAATAAAVVTADNIPSAGAAVALTDATTIAVNWNTFINGAVTISTNRTLGNPTNGQPGTWRTIQITQPAAGAKTLSFGSNYKFPYGTVFAIGAAANAVSRLHIYCRTTTIFEVFGAAGIA